jgi:deoxycytidine triphosphate deaminase
MLMSILREIHFHHLTILHATLIWKLTFSSTNTTVAITATMSMTDEVSMFLHSSIVRSLGFIENASPKQFNAASLDLINADDIILFYPNDQVVKKKFDENINNIIVEAGTLVLIHSKEIVKIPRNMCGWLSLRSTAARSWINHSSALLIQPGFSGTIAFEFYFYKDTAINRGESFMQLAISRLELPEDESDADEYVSRYRGIGHLEGIKNNA